MVRKGDSLSEAKNICLVAFVALKASVATALFYLAVVSLCNFLAGIQIGGIAILVVKALLEA